jgi:hypothetical protein
MSADNPLSAGAGTGGIHRAARTGGKNHRTQRSYQAARFAAVCPVPGFGLLGLTFGGRRAIFKHEQGALYVACLLLEPPSEPMHAVALALRAKEMGGHLREHLMTPSGRGGDHRKARALSPFAGCYTYEPPPGVVWAGKKGLLPK